VAVPSLGWGEAGARGDEQTREHIEQSKGKKKKRMKCVQGRAGSSRGCCVKGKLGVHAATVLVSCAA
jgi:hypothetical protein